MLARVPTLASLSTAPGVGARPVSGDNDLIRSLAAFEDAAWEALLAREMPRLFKFAYVRTGDAAAAEDIAAEVFEEAVRRIGRYQERGLPLSAWLFRIARNLVADHLSQRRSRPMLPLDTDAAQALAGAHRDLDSLADVSRAMRNLTRDQQEVVALRFVSGCDLRETAESMKKSVGAVKVLQHRALAALRAVLSDPAAGKGALR